MAIRNLLGNIKAVPVPAKGSSLEGEIILPSDTSRPARLGLWVLGIGFGGFLLWAGLAPLEEGVPTQGMVTIATKRKMVQHLTGGLVSKIYVREGQYVKKGAPLIALDDSLVRANYDGIRQRYLTLRAMEGRLLAEQSGQSKITFHPDLLQEQNDPLVRQTMNNQEQLFQARRQAISADKQASDEAVQGLQASIEGLDGVLASRKSQLQYVQEELKGIRDLVKEGYAPRNKQLDLERMAAEATGSIIETQSNILRANRQIAETRARATQRIQEYRKEVEGTLADVRREVQSDQQRLKAAKEELDRMVIRAPEDGQVVGLVEQTVGGVIGPGQKLMDIVPQDEPLILEARVPPQMIDRIHKGLIADVRFSAFANSPALVVQGKVISISSDVITDPRTGIPFYLGQIAITPEGVKQLGNHEMQPGMPVQVVFKTGERTVLTYLLHPFLQRLAASMKEE
ncbi:MAG TPA: HlyD family type I secretion periplasmic adaptor subunit [Rhodocyclaceae bacterium]|nr:HlyD family type I secretion periplasmic adaptor subunit [Rhodocyclaceae bacterium]